MISRHDDNDGPQIDHAAEAAIADEKAREADERARMFDAMSPRARMAVLTVPCPFCDARPGAPCRKMWRPYSRVKPHHPRIEAWLAVVTA